MPSSHNGLKNFQNQFIEALFDERQSSDFLDSITPGGSLASSYAAMGIHKGGYIARLTEALGEIYEGVWAVLGDEEFFKISQQYILSNRSNSYNLNDYGKYFEDFLKSSEIISQFSFIADLARFELAFYRAFHEREHVPLAPAELAEISAQPYSKLKFGPSVMPLQLDSRIYEIWKQRLQLEQKTYDCSGHEYLVIYQQGQQVFVKQLSAQQFGIFLALYSGVSLGAYLEQESHVDPNELSALFYFITSAGLISSIG